MQAVILAAGRGKRMGKLTDTLPKPMLSVAGKNLLEHKISALPSEIDEVIFVVGYLGEKIMEYFGDSWNGKRIRYVQVKPTELFGTGDALWRAKELLKGKFLVMMGDDIYAKEDITKCLKYDWSVLVYSIQEMRSGGKVMLDAENNLKDIVEGDHHGGSGLVNTGLYVLQTDIFTYPLVKLAGREEWGLPQTLLQAVPHVPVKVVPATSWIQISDGSDLEKAERLISS